MRIKLEGLKTDTTYYFELQGKNETKFSRWSRKFELKTDPYLIPPATPNKPTWVSVGDSFHGEWNSVTTNIQGDTVPIVRYEMELKGGGTLTRETSTTQTTGSVVTYDISFDEIKALFGFAQPELTLRVRAVDNLDVKSDWSEATVASNPPPGPPTAPPGEQVAVAIQDGISYKWVAPNGPNDDDIIGYNLYIGTSSNFTTNQQNKVYTGPGTTFTYYTTTYLPHYAKIRSVDKFNQESIDLLSNAATPVSPFIIDSTPPAIPDITSVTISNNPNGLSAAAVLDWTIAGNPTDLGGFYIRYRKIGDAFWRTAVFDKDSRNGTIDLETAYVNYQFQISAYDFTANKSAWGSTATGIAPVNSAPQNVTGLTAVPGRDAIVYSWSPTIDQDLKNYELVVSKSSTFASGNLTYLTGNAASLTVGGLDPSTTYYARVRAVDQGGLTSGSWSGTNTTATTAFPQTALSDGVVPAAPTVPTVVGGIGNLFVSWSPVTTNTNGQPQQDLVAYEIHVSTVSGFTPNAASKAAETYGTTVTLEQGGSNYNLQYGETYYVRLIAKDRDGANSTASPQASGTIKKALAADVTLSPGDVGADPAGTATNQYNNVIVPALAGKATPADIDTKVGVFTTNIFNPAISGLQTQVDNPPGAVNLIRASRTLAHEQYLHLVGGMTVTNVNVPGPIPDVGMNYPTVSVTRFTSTTTFGHRIREIRYGKGPYTFSFWARTVSGTNTMNVDINDTLIGTASINTSWQKFVFSGTSANNIDSTYNFMDLEYAGTSQIYIYQPMLETGVRASSYTPSPEELANDITTSAANSANGVNRNYSSTTVPTGTADGTGRLYVVGDNYLVRGDVANPSRITGQYEYTANNTWTSRTLSHQVIASIDVGNMTVLGKLGAANIEATSLTIQPSQVPNLTTDLANRPLATTVNAQVSTAQSTAITTAGTNADTKITTYNTNTVVPALATKATPGDIDTKVNTFNANTVQPGLITAASNGSTAAQTALKTLWGGSPTSTTINGGVIATNTILTNKLAVADFTNFVPDPEFEFNGNYALSGTVIAWNGSGVPQTNIPKRSGNVFKPISSYDLFATSDYDGFPVKEGDEFYVEAWVAHTGSETNALTFRIWFATGQHIAGNTSPGYGYPGFSVFTDGSVNASASNLTGGTAQDRWVKVAGTIKIPTDVYVGTNDPIITGWAALGTGGPTGGNGWHISGWNIRRKNGGELIVDGAITSRSVASDLFVGKEFYVSTGGSIRSANYNASSGASGWAITENAFYMKSGQIDANTIIAGTGIVNNLVVNGGGIQSANYSGGASGFRLDSSSLEIVNGTISIQTIKGQGQNIGGAGGAGTINIGAGTSMVFNGGHLRSNTYTGTNHTNNPSGAGFYLGDGGLRIDQGDIKANAISGGTFTAGTINIGSGGAITSSGFNLSSSGLTLTTGSVSAAALNIQSGSNNLFSSQYSSFDVHPSWYSFGLSVNNVSSQSVIVTSEQAYAGAQSAKVSFYANAASSYLEFFTEDVIVDPGKDYIISYYVRSSNAANALRQAPVITDNNGAYYYATNIAGGNEVNIANQNTWTRYSWYFNSGTATSVNIKPRIVANSAGITAIAYIDGLQLEQKMGNSNSPSTYNRPGLTTIDGSMIRTGEIRSTSTLNVDGIERPLWSISTTGYAQFAGAYLYGSMVVGNSTTDQSSQIASWNYVAGQSGWRIRSYYGDAEFNNVTMRGNLYGTASSVVGGGVFRTDGVGATNGQSQMYTGLIMDQYGLNGYSAYTNTLNIATDGRVTLGSGGYIRGGNNFGSSYSQATGYSTGFYLGSDGLFIGGNSTINGAQMYSGVYRTVGSRATLADDGLYLYSNSSGAMGVQIFSNGRIYSNNHIIADKSIHGYDIYTDNEAAKSGVISNYFYNAKLSAQGRLILDVPSGSASSSLRYKENVIPMSLEQARSVFLLEENTYRYKNILDPEHPEEHDPDYIFPRHAGFIAEQAAAVGAELFLHYDAYGRPESFRYQDMVVPHNMILKDHDAKIAVQGNTLGAQGNHIALLEDRIQELEALVAQILSSQA